MADFFPLKIPLPIPRPHEIEDVQVDQRIYKHIQDLPDIFSDSSNSSRLFGTDWLFYPLTVANQQLTLLKDKIMDLLTPLTEVYTNIYESSERIANLGNEALAMLLGIGIIVVVGSVIYYSLKGLYSLVNKLWK